MKKCVNCGKEELNNNAVTCSVCGGALEKSAVMFCPRCGDRINGDVAFCPKCGASLNGDENAYNEAPVMEAPPVYIQPAYEVAYPVTPKKKKGGLIALIVLVAVLIIGVSVAAIIISNQNDNGDAGSEESEDTETIDTEKPEKPEDTEMIEPEKPEEPEEPVEPEKPEIDTTEEENKVRQTMSSFSDLFLWGDDNALRYVKEGSPAYSEIEETMKLFSALPEAMETGMAESIGVSEGSRDALEAILTDFVSNYVELCEIDVESVSVEGDTAVVTTKMSVVDPDSMENMDGEALAVEAANNVFTSEEIANLPNLSGAEYDESMLMLLEEMFDLLIEDIKENNEMETETVIFYLEKVDNQWLIYKTVGLN